VARTLADRAADILESAGEGLDTDGDGLSDGAEIALSELTEEAREAFLLPGLVEIELDPAAAETSEGVPDREFVE
ncbi:MAG: hypothetical protein GWN79_14360, partial [Actinobacteria bacterium]|nr:hypothetical protein [Actinomycetota bacterium]NIS32843.1 hypothetical protein [Actinomycetota bacterium]NIT96494.1 hypothetical protein [Actinomycetota bacterium]NIU20191.1 hypothetical protein [Actinomycetota bacterium]NIU67816.1 hypothetical protein [Actinomycetota bacterium]